MNMNMVAPEEVGLSSKRLDRIGEAMQSYVDRGQPPGMITLVARRGKVIHLQCYGMMDVEAGRPMQPDTIFRIYSMTKPIASVALMMLFEEGRFALDRVGYHRSGWLDRVTTLEGLNHSALWSAPDIEAQRTAEFIARVAAAESQ